MEYLPLETYVHRPLPTHRRMPRGARPQREVGGDDVGGQARGGQQRAVRVVEDALDVG